MSRSAGGRRGGGGRGTARRQGGGGTARSAGTSTWGHEVNPHPTEILRRDDFPLLFSFAAGPICPAPVEIVLTCSLSWCGALYRRESLTPDRNSVSGQQKCHKVVKLLS